ncbi:hypothetical protein BDV96DRAFT_635955, partial [Lophiotrema nucula]
MRRGFESPVTSRAPRNHNSGTREPAAQPSARSQYLADTSATRGGIEQRQLQSTTASRNPQPQTQPSLAPAQEPTTSSRSPAYLQGKNPYGKVLDRVHLPGEEPQVAGPPSQIGSTIEGRPRTSGSFKFATRPVRPEPERAVVTPAVDGPAPTQKSISVKATKNLFESKASESRTNPPFPPKANSLSAKEASGGQAKDRPRQRTSTSTATDEVVRPTRIPSPTPKTATVRKESDPTLPIPRPPPESSKRTDVSQRTNPFVRQRAEVGSSGTLLRIADPSQDVASDTSHHQKSQVHAADIPHPSTTPSSMDGPEPAKPPVYERKVMSQSKRLDELSKVTRAAVEDSKRPSQSRTSEETVAPEGPKRISARRTEADRDVRRAPSNRFRRTESRSTQVGSTAEPTLRRSARAAATDPSHQTESLVADFGEPIPSGEKLEEIAAKTLSHDGSSSGHSFSRRISSPAAVPSVHTGADDDYYETHIPIQMDYRSGYGRRKTKDFGYPGARIKPRRTVVASKPLD